MSNNKKRKISFSNVRFASKNTSLQSEREKRDVRYEESIFVDFHVDLRRKLSKCVGGRRRCSSEKNPKMNEPQAMITNGFAVAQRVSGDDLRGKIMPSSKSEVKMRLKI